MPDNTIGKLSPRKQRQSTTGYSPKDEPFFSRKNLNLIKDFTITDFKLQYKNSSLGYFWLILMPLVMLGTLYVVFSIFMKVSVPNYQLFLLLGIILWNFLAQTSTTAISSVMAKSNLIRKVSFPKSIIVWSSAFSSLLTFFINLAVFFIFMIVFKAPFKASLLIFPYYLINLFLLVIGLSFALTAISVWFKDMNYLWQIILQIGFWLTPIIYPLGYVPAKYVKYYDLNPFARLITDSRDALINGFIPSAKHLVITFIICVSVFIIGYFIFSKLAPKFAEVM